MERILESVAAWIRGTLALIGLITVVVAIVLGGVLLVLARGETETFPGTSAPGSHQWWDINQAEAQFCTQCHSQIAQELVATGQADTHPVTSCLICHRAGGSPPDCLECHDIHGGAAQGVANCLDCHPSRAKPHGGAGTLEHGGGSSGGHAAVPAKCVDCHPSRANELANGDAHHSMLEDLGETEADASWTCKACHTKVDIEMTVTLNPPLDLGLGPTYP